MTSELTQISPSSINAFDETSSFGCERRWWFKYVLKNPEPQQESMQLGEALHLRNELYIEKGVVVEAGQPLKNYSEEHVIKSLALFERGKPWIDAHLKHTGNVAKQAAWVQGVEMPLPKGYAVAGVTVSPMSKCDVVVGGAEKPAIIDWKTTSSIAKYGKTPGQLVKDTQMLLYADAFHREALESGVGVRLVHGQYETKGAPKFQVSEVQVSKDQLDERLTGFIVPLVERMKTTYRAPAAREVKPNRNACFRCPHRGICPADKENPLMSLFSKFKKDTVVTPPDAPASDPATNAKPVGGNDVPPAAAEKVRRMPMHDVSPDAVTNPNIKLPVSEEPKAEEKFEPVPPPKKATAPTLSKAEQLRKALEEAEAEEKRAAEEAAKKAKDAAESAKLAEEFARLREEVAKSRRTGAPITEKRIVEEVVEEERKRGPGRPPGAKNKATLAKEAREALIENGPTFTKTTVSFGVTLNLGDYNSARIDVSHTIEYADGDADAAFKAAVLKCKQQVDAEIDELKAGPEKK